jgi:glycosyltransferase involved in cell wall biosynthesis
VIGGIDRRKGQDVAVAALALLREQGLAATLALVGRETDSAFADTVRADVSRLGLEGAVEFVGEVEDARPELARADIVVAPSRGEWTPLVLMEALAAGIPVVATRVGGVEDVVHDRQSGLLVSSEDPPALAAAIAELAADPPSAIAMARRGREHVEQNFRIERTLERLESELVRLL